MHNCTVLPRWAFKATRPTISGYKRRASMTPATAHCLKWCGLSSVRTIRYCCKVRTCRRRTLSQRWPQPWKCVLSVMQTLQVRAAEVGDVIYVGTNPDTNLKAIFFGSRGLNVRSLSAKLCMEVAVGHGTLKQSGLRVSHQVLRR